MQTLASADDFGLVKLFRYPCPVEKAAYQKYNGHSAHVTNVRFNKRGDYLISTGGGDLSIFQWKFGNQEEERRETEQYKNAVLENPEGDDDGDDMFGEVEEMGEGDQALAVKPFLGQVAHSIPTGWKETKDSGAAPDGALKLKYAHGFRSFDTRGNLKYIANGQVVFTTAAVGVVLD